jgi:hypothetical protein
VVLSERPNGGLALRVGDPERRSLFPSHARESAVAERVSQRRS